MRYKFRLPAWLRRRDGARLPQHLAQRLAARMLAVMAAALIGGGAAVAQTNVFAPPVGFKTETGGPAMPHANWTIWQWSAPHPFKGFYPVTINGQQLYETSAASGWAVAGNGVLDMMANGTGIACTSIQNNKSQVVEYDEQAVPPDATPLTPLSQLHNAYLTGQVAFNVGMGAGTPCPTTMTSVGDNLILDNPTNHEILFFQERLGGYSYTAGALHSFKGAAGDWFCTGTNQQNGGAGQWGYDDNITTHGMTYIQSGTGMATYNIDVLPKIEAVIAYGAAHYHMDGTLSNWVIIARYAASGNWGPIKDETLWANLALNED